MRRTAVLIALMIVSGLAANRALAVLQTHTTAAALINTTSPQVRLPGTIYVSQEGSIYAISGSSVRRLALPSGGDWTQPRVLRGRLAAGDPQVRRVLRPVSRGASGRVLSRMTSDDQSTTNGTLQLDHWILWPSISPDGSDVYFATDAPKPAPNQSYEVDFSLWSAPLSAAFSIGDTGVSGGTRWSVPDLYTGGDIAAGAAAGRQRALFELREHREGDRGDRARPADEPEQPDAVAHHPAAGLRRARGRAGRRDRGDGVHQLRDRRADLEVATLEGNTLGPLRVLVANCLCNSPSWSPSGRQPSLYECRGPGRKLRALVHRQRGRCSPGRDASGHRRQRRPGRDVGRCVVEPVAISPRAGSGRRRSRRRRVVAVKCCSTHWAIAPEVPLPPPVCRPIRGSSGCDPARRTARTARVSVPDRCR